MITGGDVPQESDTIAETTSSVTRMNETHGTTFASKTFFIARKIKDNSI